MHKFYSYLLLVLVLFITICCKKEKDDGKPVNPITPDLLSRGPAPKGMQKLTATIDSKYNMEGARVMSLFDSTLVSGNKFVLYVPANFDSQVFISDNEGDKIFALVDTHPGDTVAVVNAKSVSISLLDLLPAFASLDSLQELQVVTGEFTQSKEFLKLQSATDRAMDTKGDLWDVEASNLVDPLSDVSASLIKKYFTLVDTKGGRIATTTEIDKWLFGSPGVNAEVGNPVYSYAGVDFKAIKTNSSSKDHTFILKPRDLENDDNPNEPTSQRIDISNLPDDAYQVQITQKSATVRNKNAEVLGRAVISFLIGKVLDPKKTKPTEGSTQENCIRDVSDAVIEAVKKNTLDLVQSTQLNSVDQIVDAVIGIVDDSYKGIIESSACLKLSTKYGSKIFIKLISKRVVAAMNVFDKVKTYAEFRHIVKSFIVPEELVEDMQLHYGRLLTGRVELIQAKELEIEYKPSEIVYPIVKLSTIFSYKDIDKEGLLVKWKVKEGHGSVNLLETKLDKSGETTVGWKLPAFTPTANGEVEVTAEILDKEGDHIKGSPIVFKTKVYSIGRMLVNGSPWKVISYVTRNGDEMKGIYYNYCKDGNDFNTFDQTLQFDLYFSSIDPTFLTGTYTWETRDKYIRYTCDNREIGISYGGDKKGDEVASWRMGTTPGKIIFYGNGSDEETEYLIDIKGEKGREQITLSDNRVDEDGNQRIEYITFERKIPQ